MPKPAWVFVPEEYLLEPDRNGLYTCYYQHWWTFVPDKGLVFYRGSRDLYHISAQANTDRQITESLISRKNKPEGSEAKYFERVFVPTSHNEGYQFARNTWSQVTVEEIQR
jgi:hypothetical protein